MAAVAFVSCHPALDLPNAGETLESVDANSGVDANANPDLIRKARGFGRGFCCGGGGGGRHRRPNYGGGGFGRPYGGGGFGGGFAGASASASASSFGGGFGYGK